MIVVNELKVLPLHAKQHVLGHNYFKNKNI